MAINFYFDIGFANDQWGVYIYLDIIQILVDLMGIRTPKSLYTMSKNHLKFSQEEPYTRT